MKMQFWLGDLGRGNGMARFRDLVNQEEIGLLIVRNLGFCIAPILCNCARDVISLLCSTVAKQERDRAYRQILGDKKISVLYYPGQFSSHGMLFQLGCRQLTIFIMSSWFRLADGPICYPGLTHPSDNIMVWRDGPTCVSSLLDRMLSLIGVADVHAWEPWQKAAGLENWNPAVTFVDAWRDLNPDVDVVMWICKLLEKGTYEVRVYEYDGMWDRRPILVVSWVMFGVRGVFSVEDDWYPYTASMARS